MKFYDYLEKVQSIVLTTADQKNNATGVSVSKLPKAKDAKELFAIKNDQKTIGFVGLLENGWSYSKGSKDIVWSKDSFETKEEAKETLLKKCGIKKTKEPVLTTYNKDGKKEYSSDKKLDVIA